MWSDGSLLLYWMLPPLNTVNRMPMICEVMGHCCFTESSLHWTLSVECPWYVKWWVIVALLNAPSTGQWPQNVLGVWSGDSLQFYVNSPHWPLSKECLWVCEVRSHCSFIVNSPHWPLSKECLWVCEVRSHCSYIVNSPHWPLSMECLWVCEVRSHCCFIVNSPHWPLSKECLRVCEVQGQ